MFCKSDVRSRTCSLAVRSLASTTRCAPLTYYYRQWNSICSPHRYHSAATKATAAPFPSTPFTYQSVSVDAGDGLRTENDEEFSTKLGQSVCCWTQAGRTSAWLHIPASRGGRISAAAAHGFVFHHALGQTCTMHLWLRPQPCTVPPFATHQVGVAGVVLDDENRLLCVKEARYGGHWKFPGGHADQGEEIPDTAVREVFEETGVRARFEALLAFRHMHGLTWGTSDLFFLALLRPTTRAIALDPREIAECAWIDADRFIASTGHPLNRAAAQLAVQQRRRGGAAAGAAADAQIITETAIRTPISDRDVRVYIAAGSVALTPAAASR